MPLHSIQQLQKWGKNYIDRAEVDILIAYVLDVTKEFIIAHPEYKISKLKNFKIKKLIAKRAKGIPIAYLTGHKEFFGLDFLVNKHTLIPRPETEVLVEAILSAFPPLLGEGQGGVKGRRKIILIDIGTGSGCIPISILKSSNLQSSILTYATDISKPALNVARKNAQIHNVDITFLHGNLLEPFLKDYELLPARRSLSEGGATDSELIITANLPYLTKEQFDIEPSIQHEPTSALVADDDGLKLYKELLGQIKKLLSTFDFIDFTTFFEIDPSQTDRLSNYIQKIFPNSNIETIKDGMGNDRIIKTKVTIDKS